MSLESVFANPPPLVREDNKDSGIEDKESEKNLEQSVREHGNERTDLVEGYGTLDNGDNKGSEHLQRNQADGNHVEGEQGDLKPEGADPEDMEEGEILEDGELDNDDGADSEEAEMTKPEEEEVQHHDEQDDESSEEEDEEDSLEEKKRKKKERRKKRKERRKERDRLKKLKKKSKKRKRYIDHDNVNDADLAQSWPPVSARKQPEPYSSPQGPYGSPYRSPPGPYGSPYRSPPGPYDSPYMSPPGPYDSPDYSDDDEYGPPPSKKSLLSMVDEDYMDVNIAADEKQDMFQLGGQKKGGMSAAARQKKLEKKKMYFAKQQQMQMKREMQMQQRQLNRPQCKFYKEGKCAKGEGCQFNHDFTPPRKLEVCKFYIQGYCAKGENCIYLHKDWPCKFYHTGQPCHEGENCKFSHERLTEDTRSLLQKAIDLSEEDLFDIQGPPGAKVKKPSLLGSPPRHIKEQVERLKEQQKKIPSLFDIKVTPTASLLQNTQSPQSGQQQQLSPSKLQSTPQHQQHQQPQEQQQQQSKLQPPPKIAVSQQQPQQQQQIPQLQQASPVQRPVRPGFYKDMTSPSPSRPGLLGDAPIGPPRMPPPGPPPRMAGVMPPRPPMGPLGPMSMPPPGMTPLPPAAAAVVAAAQQAVGFFDAFFGQPPPPIGLDQPPPPLLQQPQQQQQQMPQQQPQQGSGDEKQQGEMEGDGENKPFVIPPNLPPKQRELFLRIQQQQKENLAEAEQGADQTKEAEDDNWYSSDEEESSGASKNQLTDILKSINQQPAKSAPQQQQQQQQPPPAVPLVASGPAPPVFDIAKMLSVIKQGPPPPLLPAAAPVRPLLSTPVTRPDPRQQGRQDPRNQQQNQDPRMQLQQQQQQPQQTQDPRGVRSDPRRQNVLNTINQNQSSYNKEPEKLEVITLDMKCLVPYQLKIVTTDTKKVGLPPGVDPADPKIQNDPRLKKLLSQMDPRMLRVNGQSPSRSPTDTNRGSRDPRAAAAAAQALTPPHKPQDPRSRPADPRVPAASQLGATEEKAEEIPEMPLALRQPPPLSMAKPLHLQGQQLQRQRSQPDNNSSSSSNSNKVDYRNDPRFKRKTSNVQPLMGSTPAYSKADRLVSNQEQSQPVHENGNQSFKFDKESVEYTSPLSMPESSQNESGYSAYSRQVNVYSRPPKKMLGLSRTSQSSSYSGQSPLQQANGPPNNSLGDQAVVADQDQIIVGPTGQESEVTLRDVFKTIDPTASPFC